MPVAAMAAEINAEPRHTHHWHGQRFMECRIEQRGVDTFSYHTQLTGLDATGSKHLSENTRARAQSKGRMHQHTCMDN